MENKNNSTLRVILAIVGAVVVLGTIVAAVVHFWDDIKKLLPGNKEEEVFEDFEELEE